MVCVCGGDPSSWAFPGIAPVLSCGVTDGQCMGFLQPRARLADVILIPAQIAALLDFGPCSVVLAGSTLGVYRDGGAVKFSGHPDSLGTVRHFPARFPPC